jgi:Na+/melibiose symporter-like transporter
VPRLPEVKDTLDLSNAALGSALAGMPAGALLAGLFAPVLIGRLGSARTASFGLVGLALGVAAVPLAGAWLAFAVVMVVVGAFDGVVDVAQNAHGFRVQRLYGRSIVNSFHAVWSIGGVSGGVMGSAAAGLSIALGAHLAISGALLGLVALASLRYLLPGPEDAERVPTGKAIHPAHAPDAVAPSGTGLRHHVAAVRAALVPLALLGLLAVCGAFVEEAGASWSALYLRAELDSGAAAGGLGFVAMAIAMTAGRLGGDRLVDRFGQRNVALTGGGVIAAGMGFALALPSVASTVAGFALAGLGVATLVPAVMHTADEIPGLPHGLGLAVVTWVLRGGFLLSPLLVGVVADATSLRLALSSVVGAGLVVLSFARILSHRAPAGPVGQGP